MLRDTVKLYESVLNAAVHKRNLVDCQRVVVTHFSVLYEDALSSV